MSNCTFQTVKGSRFSLYVAIVEDKSLDVFGNTPQDVKKFVECTCPKCERVLGTAKFAPHLEKCLGMGRNSSRRVNNKK